MSTTARGVEAVVGLPDPNVARTWGGRLLVDRDGTEIGTCTQIFVDDSTGRPEWATADVGSGTAFIPLVDAVEAGPSVQVTVARVAVADAPPVGDVQHLSEDEEERLYRHYGIAYSRTASDSGLPVGGAPIPSPASSDGEDTSSPPATELAAADGVDDVTSSPPRGKQRQRFLVVGAGIVAALGAIAAGLLWFRRRQPAPPPPTRTEQLMSRARSASLVLEARRRQALASAAPFLQSSKRVSAAAAQRAVVQAAPLLASSRRVSAAAAQRAGIRAAAVAEQAAALAALARTIRLTTGGGIDPEPAPLPAADSQGSSRLVGALKTAGTFGAGYLLGSSTSRSSLQRAKDTTATWAQHPAVQQTSSRLRGQAGSAWQTGSSRLSTVTTTVRGKLPRRSATDDTTTSGPSESDTTTEAAGENGYRGGSPEGR
jgi:hypothetical protein